jgi:hypothetical protein
MAGTQKVKTKMTLQFLDSGIDGESYSIAGRLKSSDPACLKRRVVEAAANASDGGGIAKTAGDGRFHIDVGDQFETQSSVGYAVSTSKDTVGSGKHRTVCGPAAANVKWVEGELDQFDFGYASGTFSGQLGSPEPACDGANRLVEVSKYPSGTYVGSASTLNSGAWSLQSAGAHGDYLATVQGVFGAAQRQAGGDLEIINCQQVFTGVTVP